MKVVGSGFSDHVDSGARMLAESGGDRAGLDAEVLQRLRKRKRHVDARHGVGRVGAIKKIGRPAPLSAGHRDACGVPERFTAGVAREQRVRVPELFTVCSGNAKV